LIRTKEVFPASTKIDASDPWQGRIGTRLAAGAAAVRHPGYATGPCRPTVADRRGRTGATIDQRLSSRKAPLGEAQLAQQLVAAPTTPPREAQPSDEDLILHLAPQSTSVKHTVVGSSVQVPVVRSQVLVGIRQVTNPGLPQVEPAEQRVILPLQFVGTRPCWDNRFTTWATQLT
jgi:hypothetical protein